MIYLRTPDAPTPSGGVRLMYELVDELNGLGMPAAVWHRAPGFRCQWFENTTKIVHGHVLELNEGDVLVASEINTALGAADELGDAKVIVLNLNHFYTFRGAGYQADWKGAYPGWPNAVGVIVVGKASEIFIRMALREEMPIHYIPLPVKGDLFAPSAKENIIATMPRKRVEDMEAVIQLLHRSPIEGRWTFDVIDGVPYEEWARRIRKAKIFLSASDREGCAFPPSESMAAGCYVIGFTGDGCRDYMLPEFCSVIEDQNLASFAAETVRVAQAFDANDQEIAGKVEAGRNFVLENYNNAKWRTGVEKAFEAFTKDAGQTRKTVVRHYAAPASTFEGELKMLARRWVPPAIVDGARRARKLLQNRP